MKKRKERRKKREERGSSGGKRTKEGREDAEAEEGEPDKGRGGGGAGGRPHLLAVLAVVHAGQRLVGEAVQVRVRPAHVAVPRPAHVALRTERRAVPAAPPRGRRRRRAPLTAHVIAPRRSKAQKPLESQGEGCEAPHGRWGAQLQVPLGAKPERHGPQ